MCFHHAKSNMASSGLRENVILTKILLTTDGTKMWVRSYGAKGVAPQGSTLLTRDVDVNCVPLCIVAEGVGPFWDSSSKVLLEMEGTSVLQDLIPDTGQLELPYVPIIRDGSLILMYISSFMVLVILCSSLPTMEKLSTLMQWSEVLPWS